MSVQWPEESNFKKEMRKWDAPKREGGMNRDGFEMYPLMLYRTQPHPINGRHEVAIDKDILSLDKTTVLLDSQAFNNSCQFTVGNPEEEERAIRDGWRKSQAEAVQFHLDELDNLARDAARKNTDDRRMSEAAKAEAEAFEQTTPHHVAEIPEQPRLRKPMSAEARAKVTASLAKARAAKAAKKAEPAV